MRVLYQIRLLLSYLVLFTIIGYSIYLIVCVFTGTPFLLPTIVFLSFLLILLILLLLENVVVKKMANRYQVALQNNAFDSILKEKIKFFYSTEIKMKMIEYKAVCNSLTGKYKEAKKLFENIPYSFLICNPELALQSVFYLTLISMIEKDSAQVKKLTMLYLKKKNMFTRYYSEKQLPFLDRRINNPNNMFKKINILTSISSNKNDYKNQILILLKSHKDTKLYNDVQNI